MNNLTNLHEISAISKKNRDIGDKNKIVEIKSADQKTLKSFCKIKLIRKKISQQWKLMWNNAKRFEIKIQNSNNELEESRKTLKERISRLNKLSFAITSWIDLR